MRKEDPQTQKGNKSFNKGEKQAKNYDLIVG